MIFSSCNLFSSPLAPDRIKSDCGDDCRSLPGPRGPWSEGGSRSSFTLPYIFLSLSAPAIFDVLVRIIACMFLYLICRAQVSRNAELGVTVNLLNYVTSSVPLMVSALHGVLAAARAIKPNEVVTRTISLWSFTLISSECAFLPSFLNFHAVISYKSS